MNMENWVQYSETLLGVDTRDHKIVEGRTVYTRIVTISLRANDAGLKARLLDAAIREVVLKRIIICRPASDRFLLVI
jgi:hypothetical protein